MLWYTVAAPNSGKFCASPKLKSSMNASRPAIFIVAASKLLSILRRFFLDMIDHENGIFMLLHFQFQTELFLESLK